MTHNALPGLGVTAGTSSDARYVVGKPGAERSQDHVFLTILTRGVGRAWQLNREMSAGPGNAVMLLGGEASTSTMQGQGAYVTLTFLRAAVESLVPDVGSAIVRQIQADNPARRPDATASPAGDDLHRVVAARPQGRWVWNLHLSNYEE